MTKPNKYAWEYSKTKFWTSNTFNTIEECIEDCKNYCLNHGLSLQRTIKVGELCQVYPNWSLEKEQMYYIVDVGKLLNEVYIDVAEKVTKTLEAYDTKCTNNIKENDKLSEQLNAKCSGQLNKMLKAIINRELNRKRKKKSNFYLIRNVKEVEIK